MTARRQPAIRGRELFFLPALSPRQKFLVLIKREAVRLALGGDREDRKFAERLFRVLPELRGV
jgi:hypothetical protein